MKVKQSAFCSALVMCLSLPPLFLYAQEIPVTTSSKEAKKIFLQGRDKLENAETIIAAELFDKAIALDANFALAYLYRSQSGGSPTLTRQNREKAVSLIDKVSEGEKYVIQLTQATADGNVEKRKECVEQLVRLFPKDKRVYLWSGFYQNSMQRYTDAAANFNKAIEIDKNYGPAFNLLGYAHMNSKNWGESEKAFKRYIELLPNSPNPYDSYAEMLLKSGRYDEAITNFKKAYAASPSFINAFNGMGASFIHKGDFVNARECYKQQLEKAPSYSWKVTALINYVQSYLHEGLPEEAIKKYQDVQALAQNEKQQQGIINSNATMGWIHLENSELLEAVSRFNEARILTETADLTASARETQRLNRKIERFQVLVRIKEFELAEQLLMECKNIIESRKNPFEMGSFHTNWGILEMARGNYDKALEAFSKSNPDDPYSMFYKAMTLEKKGERDDAMKTYKEVVNWNWLGIPYALVRARAKQKLNMNIGSIN